MSGIWRRARVLLVVLGVLLVGHAHVVQSGERVYHVVITSITGSDVLIPQVRGFYDGLEELGYADGKNLVLHKIHAESESGARASLKELIRRQVDAIVTTSAAETAIAKGITSTIPIIFAPARNPIQLGFIQSYARPGGNLTGLSYSRNFEDSAKQLAVFKQTLPMMRHVIVLYSPRQTPTDELDALKRAAAYLKVELNGIPVMSFAEAERALRANSKASTDAVFLVCSALFRELKTLTDLTLQKGLPLFGCTGQHVAEEGALITYTPDIYLLGYRAAWYVDRVLKGAKPQDLPVEVPSRFEMVINLKTSKALGIKIPPEKLILADKVFQ